MAASLPSVLVVDESVDTLEMYAVGLRLAGYAALTATDAESGLDEIKRARPTAIVTELRLAGRRTGWDLLQDIRNDPDTRAVPVILLTGQWQSTLAEDARYAGFVASLLKPCSPSELTRLIDLLSKPAPVC